MHEERQKKLQFLLSELEENNRSSEERKKKFQLWLSKLEENKELKK